MAHILVVDDNLKLAGLLASVLRLTGFKAVYADSGAAALKVAGADPPVLILLDLMMPDLDGYQVLRALRADPRTANVPVIVCSALDDPEARKRSLQLGAQHFLTKDTLNLEDLQRVVQQYVSVQGPDFSEHRVRRSSSRAE